MKMPPLFDLTGRVAVVTGGNGGIGRGIALGLAEAGAAVAVFGRNDEKNHRVLSELKAIGVPSLALKVDVTNRAGLEPALKKVESELGCITILVNNAGIGVSSGGVLLESLKFGTTPLRRNSTQCFFSRSSLPDRWLVISGEKLSISAVCTRSLDVAQPPLTAQ